MGIQFELVPGPLRRGKRDALEALTGQRQYPAIELEDGTVVSRAVEGHGEAHRGDGSRPNSG